MDRKKLTLRLPAYSTPLILLLLAVLAFGLLVRHLGFYWDDWPAAWYYHTFGGAGFTTVFSSDRPVLGWLYSLTTPLMGSSPLRWHIFGLLARWLCTSLFWLTLLSIWPRKAWLATTAALLFLVYPGFSQQPIVITYSHVWLLLGVFLASLTTMVYAVRWRRWFWPLSILSWLLSALTLFTVEYFFGLELLRPVILWLVLKDEYAEQRSRLRAALFRWLPYVLILVGFLIWRFLLTNTPRGQVTLFADLAAKPFATLTNLLQVMVDSILAASLNAWGAVTQISGWFDIPALTGRAAIWIVLAAGLITLAFLWLYQPGKAPQAEKAAPDSSRQAIGLGLAALVLSGIPFWLTDLPIRLEFPWDRFTLAMIFGISLTAAGLLDWMISSRRVQLVLLSIVVGLAVGVNDLNAAEYSRRWAVQQNFFWQLVWRAPQIEPGTALITDDWAFSRSTDNSLTAPLNWTYAPEQQSAKMSYLLIDIPTRLGLSLPGLEPDLPIEEDYRIASFSGSTSQVLVFYFDPPNCLRILDPDIDRWVYRYPSYLYQVLPLSRLELINTDPAVTARPPTLFGTMPRQDWCYFYQNADLAVHQGDYETAVELGDIAFDQGFYPRNAYEYLPLIEANAFAGRWAKASNMTRNALSTSYSSQDALCAVWSKINQKTADTTEKNEAMANLGTVLDCTGP